MNLLLLIICLMVVLLSLGSDLSKQTRLIGLVSAMIGFIFCFFILLFQEPKKPGAPSALDQQLELVKDFYEGKPVPRHLAFWEWERGKPGNTMIPEMAAKKYGLNPQMVIHTLHNLENQYLIYSPAGRPMPGPITLEPNK